MRENCLQDTLAILDHLMVPEAKHSPASTRRMSVTDIVVMALRVLRTVGLDDQLSSKAKKVDDTRPDRNLPAKLAAIQPTIAKEAPQPELGVSRRCSHRSGPGALVR